VRLAVVSQKARAGLVQLLEQLEIGRYFDLVLGSDDVTVPKPQAALFERHVASRYPGVAVDRVLVVGDTAIDLLFAANIGASSCWAEYGYGDERGCRALGSTYSIADVKSVLPVILRRAAPPPVVRP
jgi:phosphoglycolate phosphatase